VTFTNMSPALSKREIECLTGFAQGKTVTEIGAELFISANTVKTHGDRIRAKLCARNTTHAVVLAVRAGLLTLVAEDGAA
jgi:DNA-binding NarL/FixJ family response regulator